MRSKKSYGWLPDIPDQRDYFYKAIKPKIKLPAEIDLRKYCSIIEDQGNLGSCTAQALAGNLEFLDNQPDSIYTDVSRLFIYYNERVGYNQKQKRFLVRNSWGKVWGKAGCFTMPYEYLETQAADFWTIRK